MGPKLKVKTVAGDIMLMEECFSEVNFDFLNDMVKYLFKVLELYTDTGHIHVRKHFGKATCLIKEEVRLKIFLQIMCKSTFRAKCSMCLGTAVLMQWSKRGMLT